jgi:hypothetical protein
MAVKPVGSEFHKAMAGALPAFDLSQFADVLEALGEEIARQVSSQLAIELRVADWDRFSHIAGGLAARALACQAEFLFEHVLTLLPAELTAEELEASLPLRRKIMEFRDTVPWQVSSIAAAG